jgi:hypothetical protein
MYNTFYFSQENKLNPTAVIENIPFNRNVFIFDDTFAPLKWSKNMTIVAEKHYWSREFGNESWNSSNSYNLWEYSVASKIARNRTGSPLATIQRLPLTTRLFNLGHHWKLCSILIFNKTDLLNKHNVCAMIAKQNNILKIFAA